MDSQWLSTWYTYRLCALGEQSSCRLAALTDAAALTHHVCLPCRPPLLPPGTAPLWWTTTLAAALVSAWSALRPRCMCCEHVSCCLCTPRGPPWLLPSPSLPVVQQLQSVSCTCLPNTTHTDAACGYLCSPGTLTPLCRALSASCHVPGPAPTSSHPPAPLPPCSG